MTRDIDLPEGIGNRIGTRHDDAATGIGDSAGSMPAAADGGLASSVLAEIVAGVSGTAGDLADLNTATAAVVRDTEGAFGETDSEVGVTLRDMNKELEEQGA